LRSGIYYQRNSTATGSAESDLKKKTLSHFNSVANIRLTLAYDGTDYVGWQVQPRGRTVQAEVEAAITAISGESVRVLAAGRTDSGVHALGQVANFHSEFPISGEQWRSALQSKLPADVVILESRVVDDDFHATYSVKSKRYRYVIRRAETEHPFLRRYAWRVNTELDVAAMDAAARMLLGTHDFRCFESHWPNKASSVRTVLDVRWETAERWPVWSPEPLSQRSRGGGRDEFLCFEIEADGFLYNMVRAIVGTLVDIGRGKRSVENMREIVDARDRGRAGETAPAHGLYLASVTYDE
jgi:tRNA pseudouridine38-40 synthase